MKTVPVHSEREGDFVILTLCQPDRRNPLSQATLEALLAHLTQTGSSDARGVILAAEGPVFSNL